MQNKLYHNFNIMKSINMHFILIFIKSAKEYYHTDHIYILGNPTLGYATTVNEFMEGLDRIDELFDGFTVVNSACVRREIFEEAQAMTGKSLVPLDLFLTYSWVD